jgi:hypothetical protein
MTDIHKYMSVKSLFLTFFLVPFFSDAQGIPVKARHSANGTIIILSRSIQKAIRAFDSSFVPLSTPDYSEALRHWNDTGHNGYLSFCTGDFDGNGLADAVLLGRSAGGMRMIAALQEKKNVFKILRVKEFPFFEAGEEDAYLAKNPAGALNVTSENRTLSFTTDTFLLNYYRRGSMLYHWNKKEFIQYQIGH